MGKRRKGWNAPEGTNTHHRRPKSRGGSNNSDNLATVPIRHHNAYNMLFGSNPLPHEVAKVLNETWIDPQYEIIVKRREAWKNSQEQNVSSDVTVEKSTASENGSNRQPRLSMPSTPGKSTKSVALALIALAQQILLEDAYA